MHRNNLCEDYHREYLEKVCLTKNYNCGRRGSILKFSLQQAPVLMKMKTRGPWALTLSLCCLTTSVLLLYQQLLPRSTSATKFLITFFSRSPKYPYFIFPYDCHIYHKVWPRLDKNGRSSILKFPAPYGSVLTKISKCHKIFKFQQIAKKGYSLNSLVTNILKIWLELNENWGSSSLMKILTSEIWQSATNDSKPNSRNRSSKVP